MTTPEDLQRSYYAETAHRYELMHVHDRDEHYTALRYISGFVDTLAIESLLDVGSGTGRALRFLAESNPGLEISGIEPVPELIEQAVASGVPGGVIRQGDGQALPFEDDAFDAVCEISMLHHVPDPGAVVDEMTRVARRAVFISDENMFGWGTSRSRFMKLGLYKLGLLKAAERVRNRGRSYRLTEDDGVSYPFSAFQAHRQLAAWADRLVVIPTNDHASGSWLGPLLTADHVLICALRDS